jgi:hypothetical protein
MSQISGIRNPDVMAPMNGGQRLTVSSSRPCRALNAYANLRGNIFDALCDDCLAGVASRRGDRVAAFEALHVGAGTLPRTITEPPRASGLCQYLDQRCDDQQDAGDAQGPAQRSSQAIPSRCFGPAGTGRKSLNRAVEIRTVCIRQRSFTP